MNYLGINAIFHDPAAALVVDGRVVAAAEEERFSRRKHGKRPVPFSAWELPEQAMHWCLAEAGLTPADLDAVGYSFDPAIAAEMPDDPYDPVRVDYARRAAGFLAEALPGLDRDKVRFVEHHVAHAASAGLAAPTRTSSVLVVDGRGEAHSHLAGRYRDGELEILHRQALPESLGLLYESLTDHLGFLRSSDEFKVMALASYGEPRFLPELREIVRATGDGGFRAQAPDWTRFAPRRIDDGTWGGDHADLAASVQAVVEEVLVDLATWLHGQTGDTVLTMAGGTALNCVANSRIWRETPFEEVWVQPASGDSGTALGAALHLAQEAGDLGAPQPTAALGRSWSGEELAQWLSTAQVPFTTPEDLAGEVADILAGNGVIAWFEGRSEFGPRALGRRSLLANPIHPDNLERLNDVKGREQFRPVAPMVLEERAAEIFGGGPLPSPFMLFVHDVAPEWRERIPTVTHVDGTARIQTVTDEDNAGIAALLRAFDERTGVPVVVNTSLNTAGRPMVDDPRDALELFGSAPVAALVLGPHLVRRAAFFEGAE
ncbi:carbamoyltransferase [Kocuria rosea]|uniref:carbamoyltransferase family protein n=1 Tax=Kocuria rosea TaxID=1275 RepID=UPI000D64FB73|nr:carbamoyltransferase C-terminal domain-containing protein [Kocuria rosea]MEB2526227.1 carbamoyltransferase C-terminal domain-containing protein [Kocuria rosea]MEB2616976.1 carbamoyltransferase C-terminal domain-containing protein [Kocuria rosea]PWF85047.1 carbamoyltransferase [Kocuria rosea]QCY33180.1 carbamoyltransferase [Kocuria rosea]TQN36304.1 carbamoyltransferase [Kocuria rosea]